jgi:type IV secretory pathway VirJ component
MKNAFWVIFICYASLANAATEETLTFGRFGQVRLYRQTDNPQHVVLFVSGDGGWNSGVVDMAKELAKQDALVVGIDIVHYLAALAKSTEPCLYPAADFELLSKFVQQKLNFRQYNTPVLVGYSSGATLVYALLVQAPPATFRGAISLGFCPDLSLDKPMCKGSGLEWRPGAKGKGCIFAPNHTLETPWIALQGEIDQVCDTQQTNEFVHQVKNGTLVLLPKVGHGFSVSKNWLPQFKDAFRKIIHSPAAEPPVNLATEINDLPLVHILAKEASSDLFAVHITGDGGWGVTDKGIANSLVERGISVVGLNSLKYFWTKRTPAEAGRDLQRVLQSYSVSWNKNKIILIGYSLGADVLPFMISELAQEWRNRIVLVVLLGPSETVEFEFHLTDWVSGSNKTGAYAVVPEVAKLRGLNILCFCGQGDKEAICEKLAPDLATTVPLAGGHRIGGNFTPIVTRILAELKN